MQISPVAIVKMTMLEMHKVYSDVCVTLHDKQSEVSLIKMRTHAYKQAHHDQS